MLEMSLSYLIFDWMDDISVYKNERYENYYLIVF
jgi:hypothetical protein